MQSDGFTYIAKTLGEI